MFLLNDVLIQKYLQRPSDEKLFIEPFEERNLQHTSYYYRLGRTYWRRNAQNDRDIMILEGRDPYIDKIEELSEGNKTLRLRPKEYVIVETLEHFRLDATVFAIFGGVSAAAQRGIQVVNSPFIDPLFGRGRPAPLTIGLRNLNPDEVSLTLGDNLGKIAFFDVSDTYPVELRPGSDQAERFV